MDGLFPGASSGLLRAIAEAFRSGRLGPTASRLSIARVCACPDEVIGVVTRLLGEGLTPAHLALLLDAHAAALEARMSGAQVELVWTGPETENSHSRDTSVVARDLFATAQRSVLVSSYVLRDTRAVMQPLGVRMEAVLDLCVRLFVHVPREWRDTRHESELLREFGIRLRSEWPGSRVPEVYYDPRSLSADPDVRATWHAKCVVVDEEVAFITSANFTEWAQQRNVEAGVLVRDRQFAGQLLGQFQSLMQAKQVRRLPGF